MNISSTQIKLILQEYDKQMSTSSYLYSSITGEYKDISDLRIFFRNLPPSNSEYLSPKARLDFISILVDSLVVGASPHDSLIRNLKALVGDDVLKAFTRLKSRGLLAEEYIEKVENHTNPQSFARMITHFTKHNKITKNNNIQANVRMDTYASKADPYLELKTETANERVLNYIKYAPIDSDESKNMLMQHPIISAKILNKFIINNVLITRELILMCLEHQNPVNMALAFIALNKYTILMESPSKDKILTQAKAHQNPLGFIQGTIFLEKNGINTEACRRIIAQSNSPEMSAQLIFVRKFKEQLSQTGTFSYGLFSTYLLFSGITDPLGYVDSRIKKLEDELANSSSTPNM